jgi:hypothetical protein
MRACGPVLLRNSSDSHINEWLPAMLPSLERDNAAALDFSSRDCRFLGRLTRYVSA